jgi:hypothetical protein
MQGRLTKRLLYTQGLEWLCIAIGAALRLQRHQLFQCHVDRSRPPTETSGLRSPASSARDSNTD